MRHISRIIVTPDMVRDVLEYNHETGVMTWKERPVSMFKNEDFQKIWNTRFAGNTVGTRHTNGYLKVTINYKQLFVHRVAFAHYYERWPDKEIDHINNIRDDNRIVNLREVTRTENLENQSLISPRNKSSGLLGVHWSDHVNNWVAHITTNKKIYHLGVFDDKYEAQKAYLSAKEKVHAGWMGGADCEGID